ncbi:MAG: universal stress protein [Dehalococcoidia bacterium]
MYERVLVPLDGSELAEIALLHAARLAGKRGAEIRLIYVSKSHEAQNSQMQQAYLKRIVEEVKRGAEKYIEGPAAKAINVESIVLPGDPAEEIVEYADKEDIGLIIMATLGRSGLKRWALGSVADRVVRATKRPVALIRANTPHPVWDDKGKVIICLDGSRASEAIIPYVEGFASNIDTELILFEVLEMGHYQVTSGGYDYVSHAEDQLGSDRAAAEDYLSRIGAGIKQKGITVKTEVRFGHTAEEIIKFAEEISADVVAMSTHGRSGIARWALGSVADRVLRRGTKPLLLVRPPKK